MHKSAKALPERNHPNFLNGFFWGTMIGGTAIFLFGTSAGKKVKKFLLEHGEQLLDDLEEEYQSNFSKQGEKIELRAVKPKKQHQKSEEKKQNKQINLKKTGLLSQQDLSRIEKLQERGRNAAQRFFTRGGRSLK